MIKNLFAKYKNLNVACFLFFGNGIFAIISILIFQLVLLYFGLIYLITTACLLIGLYQMTLMEWVKNYQTLITGILALLAAWWTVTKMEKQILLTKFQNEDAINRKRKSIRASLVSKLDQAIKYSRTSCYVLRPMINNGDYVNLNNNAKLNIPFPKPLERELIHDLCEVIEYAPNKRVEELISLYLNYHQIMNARMVDLEYRLRGNGNNVLVHEIKSELINFGLMTSAIAKLFPYARLQKEVPDKIDVNSVLENLGEIYLEEETRKELRKIVNSRLSNLSNEMLIPFEASLESPKQAEQ